MSGWPAGWVSICGKNFKILIFSDTVNVINVKLCMMVLLIELYLFIPLSVTLTIFQGHRYVSLHWKDHWKYDLCNYGVYSREIIKMLLVGQVSGLVKTFNIWYFLRHLNVLIVKFCMIVLHIELYLFISHSVTLTIFQGHSIVSFNWKFYVPIRLSQNFMGLLSVSNRSWIYHLFWWSLIFKRDNRYIFSVEKM